MSKCTHNIVHIVACQCCGDSVEFDGTEVERLTRERDDWRQKCLAGEPVLVALTRERDEWRQHAAKNLEAADHYVECAERAEADAAAMRQALTWIQANARTLPSTVIEVLDAALATDAGRPLRERLERYERALKLNAMATCLDDQWQKQGAVHYVDRVPPPACNAADCGVCQARAALADKSEGAT